MSKWVPDLGIEVPKNGVSFAKQEMLNKNAKIHLLKCKQPSKFRSGILVYWSKKIKHFFELIYSPLHGADRNTAKNAGVADFWQLSGKVTKMRLSRAS